MIRTHDAGSNAVLSFKLGILTTLRLIAFLLCAASSLCGQSLTLTGHVSNVQAPLRQAAFCGCVVGDPVTATIELRTYFVTTVQISYQSVATFPLTAVPKWSGIGLPEMEFAGNSFSLQIGSHTWVNQFVTTEEQNDKLSGVLQVSKPGRGPLPNTFSNVFSTGFAVRESNRVSGERDIERTEVVALEIDSTPSPLWNITGDSIGMVIPRRAAIALSLGDNSFNSITIAIDRITANTAAVSRLDLNAVRLQEQQKQKNPSSSAAAPPPSGPFFPPPNMPGAAPARALFQTAPFNPCQLIMSATSGVARNLLNLAQERSLVGIAEGTLRAEVAEWLLILAPPTVCTTQIIMQAMASSGNPGGSPSKGAPKTSPNFKPPTNQPQQPPANVPAGLRVRVMGPTNDYPNGYWRLEKQMSNGGWQGVNPSTMKPGPQWETHVPLPPP